MGKKQKVDIKYNENTSHCNGEEIHYTFNEYC